MAASTDQFEGLSREDLEEEYRRLTAINANQAAHSRFFFFDGWGQQPEFLDHPAQIRIITGGNRTGKSTIGIIELIAQNRGVRPDGSRSNLFPPPVDSLVIVRDRRKSIDKVVMKKLKHYCAKGWIVKMKNGSDGLPEKLYWDTGSMTLIGSQNQDPDSYEGTDWHFVWFDEPPSRKLWIAIRRGLMDVGGRVIFTMTPLGCAWIKRELHDRADGRRIETFNLNLEESPYIPKEEIEAFKRDLTEEEYQARVLGKFSHLQGRILPNFKRSRHVIPPITPERSWPRFVVMDPHARRPAYIAWFTINPREEIICYNEWPKRDFYGISTAAMSVGDYVNKIRSITKTDRIYEYIMDPNFGKTPSMSSGMTLVEEFDEYDMNFFVDINNDIAVGHARIIDRLGSDDVDPSLYICSNCVNMVSAMENYIWDEKSMEDAGNREIPGEYGKDMVDTLRYLLDYDPMFIVDDYSGGGFNGEEEDRGPSGY